MFLKSALNALSYIHSRAGSLKRLGTPDIFSPCRITPCNYSRFLAGPQYTTIKGVEFIIPVDTLLGQYAQKLSFSAIPDSGTFRIAFGANSTADINFDATAAGIQTALRLIVPLADVVVTGSFLLGFTITFVGFDQVTDGGQVTNNTLMVGVDAVTTSWTYTSTPWSEIIRKGDRIVDGAKLWTIDDIIEMHDLGAQVMAYRVNVN